MENMLGKIVLEKNQTNPRVIIAVEGFYMAGLELVKESDNTVVDKHKIKDEDFVKFEDYKGKKLVDVSANCDGPVSIVNLNIREIGRFTEKGYYNLLRVYVNCQAAMGGRNPSYLGVRDEVHGQMIKMINKKF